MDKIRFIIPNLFTAFSLCSALISLHFIYEENYLLSAWLVAVSMLFDGLDGKIARLLNANSKFGAMFDTLSDFVAFGVVPGFLAYKAALSVFGWLGAVVSMFYVFCGSYRLVRFTLNSSKFSIKHSFSGLPIPAAAGFIASFVILNHHFWQDVVLTEVLMIILLVASVLMISKIEYLAIEKRKKLTKESVFFIILACISVVLSIWFSYLLFTGWILLYILYGIVRQIIRKWKK